MIEQVLFYCDYLITYGSHVNRINDFMHVLAHAIFKFYSLLQSFINPALIMKSPLQASWHRGKEAVWGGMNVLGLSSLEKQNALISTKI